VNSPTLAQGACSMCRGAARGGMQGSGNVGSVSPIEQSACCMYCLTSRLVPHAVLLMLSTGAVRLSSHDPPLTPPAIPPAPASPLLTGCSVKPWHLASHLLGHEVSHTCFLLLPYPRRLAAVLVHSQPRLGALGCHTSRHNAMQLHCGTLACSTPPVPAARAACPPPTCAPPKHHPALLLVFPLPPAGPWQCCAPAQGAGVGPVSVSGCW
jgi:hypothetical protein